MRTFIDNYKIYFYLIIFIIFSYISIYNASLYISSGDLYYKQLLWYILGIIIILIIKKINIKKIYNISIYLYIINVLLLLGVLFFGVEVNNSRSWYKIFSINIQPNEFMKPILILFNSYIIDKFYNNKNKISFKQEFMLITTLFIVTMIPSILAFLEPDTGSVIAYFIITISMLYIAGINKKWFYFLFFIILFISISIIGIYLIDKKLIVDLLGSKFLYRIERIVDWQSKNGMQLNNSLIAIGSSGLFGHNYVPLYYPEGATDFIFTSFSSSFGLIGSILFIYLLLSFDLYILKIIKRTNKKENKYTLFGILILFFYQQFQSISMTVGITPINGITLPLISYGGSSLLSYMFLISIIVNINKKRKINLPK